MFNLRAGYGRAGELMLRQGHKIPSDREHSIVARAARDRDLVVVNDVTAEPDHLPNMLLPDTKSEVAVPAIVGDELLGVLDVQADEVDFFTESDLDVYRTLVGQIATAYQNARYFERQHESEAALRESAEKIRAIFNAMTDGISVSNMTGEVTDLNDALLDLHGYEQREELMGRNMMELIARDDWATATESINHTLDTGSTQNKEMLLVRKGGGVFDGEISTAILQDDEGNPTGIIAVVRDITERKRREAALRLTRASVDNAEDEIFWFDTEGNFFDVNRAACEILGYTREELLEMQVFDVDPDFPEEAWPGLVAQLREEGAVTLTSRHITKEGDIFPVEVTVNYLKFGGDEYFFSFAHDITERQRVEEERRRFTTQLRTAAEVAAQINAILDPQALLAEVVPLVQERFDLYHVHVYTLDEETDELVMRVGTGKAGRVMLEEGHKIALDRQKSLVARSARSKQPVLVNDVTQDPDFMPNPLLPDTKSEVAVPAIAGDRVLGVFDVQDDERNRFTESDLDVFTTLASQIAIAFQNAQYFEEVQRTAERLREVDRLKGEFLANMSHELRTPLNSILGYTEVILMGIDGPLNDEMKEDVDAIHKNGKHLLRLINDILDLTKIEAGRLKLEKEEVYVAPLFDDVRTNNIGYFHKQKSDIDFRVKVLDEDMRIHADRVRLTQILNNLVSNAAKFTDEGFVEMRAYREGDWACMEVEDTGIGISEDDLETVFERFRQVDGSNARRAEGTGLGLAITKHLVEMHGGHLEVHSEPDKGSIFSAYLPIYEPEAETAEEDPTG
jgi:PAS domain S-box-containing protein